MTNISFLEFTPKRSESGSVFEAMHKVMESVRAIGKDQKNKDQGFNYRGIDDIYNHIQSELAKNGLFCSARVLHNESEVFERTKTYNGSTTTTRWNREKIWYVFTFFHKDGSFIEIGAIQGEGLDNSDKASNKALSVAHKYCFLTTFCIPTKEMDDPDGETPDTTGEVKKEQPKAPTPEPVTPEQRQGLMTPKQKEEQAEPMHTKAQFNELKELRPYMPNDEYEIIRQMIHDKTLTKSEADNFIAKYRKIQEQQAK